MTNGRIVCRQRDIGAGFCLTDRVVATAAHVVRGRTASELVFVTGTGARARSVQVEKVEIDETIDVALLWVGRSMSAVPALAEVAVDARWSAVAQSLGNDPQLSGTVTAVDHLIENAGGFETSVLQLHVVQELKNFGGYSGSAVTTDGAVVGILLEQVAERTKQATNDRRWANVLYAVPIRAIVRRFRLSLPVRTARPTLPVVQQLLDTAYFDLDPLKSAILDAKAASAQRLLGFGISSSELVVVRKLCDWLPQYVTQLEVRDWINLHPDATSPDAAVKSVMRYVAARANAVCPVIVDQAPNSVVAEFWTGVQAQCSRLSSWLILLFTGGPATNYPSGVTPLPVPRFETTHLADWAHDIVAVQRWPAHLAEVWRDQLVEAASDGGDLSIRFTYEALTDSINELRADQEALRHQLEERYCP